MIWGEPADLSHVEGGPVEIQLWHTPVQHEEALAGAGYAMDTWPGEVMQALEGAAWGGFALVPTGRTTTVEEGEQAIAQVLDDSTTGYQVRFGGFVSGNWDDGRRILPLVGVGDPPADLGLRPSEGYLTSEDAGLGSPVGLGAIDEVLGLADRILDAADDPSDVAWAAMLRPGLERLRVSVEKGELAGEDERRLREQLISTAHRILALAKAGAVLVNLAKAVLVLLGAGT